MDIINLSIDTIYCDVNAQIIMWISAIVLFLVIEAATSSLTTIWFSLGSVAAAILAAFNVSLEWQIITFVCVSALMLILTRPLVKKFNKRKTSTNKDNLIGVPSYVTEKIDNIAQTGYVKINDVYWAARSIDNSVIEVGTLIEVKKIDGNKLIVDIVKGDN